MMKKTMIAAVLAAVALPAVPAMAHDTSGYGYGYRNDRVELRHDRERLRHDRAEVRYDRYQFRDRFHQRRHHHEWSRYDGHDRYDRRF